MINSFYSNVKTVFEINYEHAIKSYFDQKFKDINNALFKENALELRARILKSNLRFRTNGFDEFKDINDQGSEFSWSNRSNSLKHFGSLFSKFKNALQNHHSTSSKSRQRSNSSNNQIYNIEFRLDNLPYLFCMLNATGDKLFYKSFSNFF